MSNPSEHIKYDEVLSSILVNEKSILGFLSAIFNFLRRRTDFYYVPDGPYENMGFPPGVAEQLVVKVLRSCDPKNWKSPNEAKELTDLSNEIMCSTVAQEVEIESENVEVDSKDATVEETTTEHAAAHSEEIPKTNAAIEQSPNKASKSLIPEDYTPPIIPTQRNSDTYNGAERDNYLWSQTITELEVTVKLPPDIKKSKDLNVTINSGDICVARCNGDIILKDNFPYKIKAIDSFWSISEGKLLIHLEKLQERWWKQLLNQEEPIDLSKIDCSRPLNELPEDHIAKVRELQWNQEQKVKGLPTSEELRNMEILKKAWNAAGSPFKGTEFDPSVLHHN